MTAVRGAVRRAGARGARRRAWYGLLTLFGLAKRGYFIPSRTAGAAKTRDDPAYPAAEAVLAAHAGDYRAVLGWLDDHAADLARIGGEDALVPGPRWDQDWFPRLDAAVAYAMVRRHKPQRIVEVGSGHSTRFVIRAAADAGLATRITAIDPAPRAEPAAEGAVQLELIRKTVQEAGEAPFRALAAGDLLLIDSSHVLMPGSDVDLLLSRVLPSLPSGVSVQIHDVFLPDDYPLAWQWRGYNEQLAVLPLLVGGAWRPRFASHYVATRMPAALAGSAVARLPLAEGARESALWLAKA